MSESLTFAVNPILSQGLIDSLDRSMSDLESFHDQGDHFTRDISSDVPVNYDTRRYLNSLKGLI